MEIKSADSFMRDYEIEILDDERASGVYYKIKTINNMMIDFAKAHVKAALEAAYQNGKVELSGVLELPLKTIDKDSILNAYPLTNIK